MGKTARARDGPGKSKSKQTAQGPPWDKIKAEYLATDTSLRKLADKFQVPLSAIAARSKGEKWQELRERVKDKTETKMVEKISTTKADALTMVRDTAIETLYALNMAAKNISLFLQHPPEPDEDHNKGPIAAAGIYSAEIAKPLQAIASSLKTTQDILYLAYNKLTPAQTESNKINLKRLQLQEKMAEIKAPAAGESFQIIITPPANAVLPTDDNGEPRPVTLEDLSG